MTTALTVNGKRVAVTSTPDTPLLYVLRDELALNGAKYGCGAGQCGACTVLCDGRALRSCFVPVRTLAGRSITTIEGLRGPKGGLHRLQKAFLDQQAAQCGYCTAGMIMGAAALLREKPRPTEEDVRTALSANLCRCGTHNRIVHAVLRAAEAQHG
ncbi:nicotinate dehydrogenase subunit A [Sphingomonas vulcanisoli]|uniref:Nicotinate dehydrogenase subunit A n=1 Tax=Sphingomonas vulcanisoli TaxID=1658060 RepID=A0ABX0TVS0_9SPHN|nr:(2Fe-2S)-binding protein [Sphingomonas vulcanisoli]NIJ09639.1 nicotinate dehydrogenase subunit A [Sphingomonas vulcanisoli]